LVTEAAMAGADIAADTSSIMIIRFIIARRRSAAPVSQALEEHYRSSSGFACVLWGNG
jgi:hypothetical protein